MKKHLLATFIGLNMTAAAQAATPTMEEMWQLIQQQQSEIAELKHQLNIYDERFKETVFSAVATIIAFELFSL